MLRSIVNSSLKARAVVLALAVVIIVAGVVQLRDAPRDVLPEFTEPTVEVQTEALGLSAPEVEQLVTVPLEQDLLNGTPFVDKIRSHTVPGLSSIELVFKHGTDLAHARQVVTERLTQAAGIPNVSKPPQMLQPLSSTSRVMLVGLSTKRLSLIDLGVLARWTIRPRLMGVPGVANVSIFGQRERQLQVQVDPKELASEGVSLDDVITTTGNALWWSPLGRLEANTPGTGGFLDGPNQRLNVFHQNPIRTPQDLARVSLESNADTATTAPGRPAVPGATPAAAPQETTRLGDVAEVVDEHQPLIGDSIVGNNPGLLLMVQKFPDANVVDVTRGIDQALDELAPGLAGVRLDRSVFRPATYVKKSTNDALTAFAVGIALLALVVAGLLLGWRVALVSAVAMVVSLFGALLVLRLRGETVNLMVLAGLALAVVVLADDVTGDVERIRRRLRDRAQASGAASKAKVVLDASLEGRRPLAYATVIALLVLLPIVVLKGEVGAFLPSIAFSYAVAIVVSMLVALTITPVLAVMLLPDTGGEGRESPVLARLQRGYTAKVWPLAAAWRGGIAVLGVLVIAGAVTVPFLDRGHSLVPSLHDRNLLVQFDGAPGTSLTEMDRLTTRAGLALRKLPGVRNVGAQIGRAVLGDRVVGANSSEIWVMVKQSADYDTTVRSIRRVIDGYPGIRHAVLTYPGERINEVLHKPERDLTVRVYGADPSVLRAKANEVRRALSKVHGVSNPTIALPPTEPTFQVEVNLAAAQRYGVKPGDVRRAAATVLSGLDAGALFQDQKVFDVVVVGTPETRANMTSIRDMLIDTPDGNTVRLGAVADVRITATDTVIDHEDVSRYVDVGATVHGREVGAVAGDVRQRLKGISFPLEHHAVVLNDYSHHRSAFLRFLGVSIAAAIGIFLLLQAATGSWRVATLAIVMLPAALAGGFIAAAVNGGRISIGTLAGFLVVFTIAIRQFLVTSARYDEIAERDDGSREAVIARAMRERIAPIVVTTVGAVALLLPYVVFGTTAGYEVIHPMAVVVLGGIVTAAIVNLFVVPALYVRFGPTHEREPEVIVDLTREPARGPNGEGRVVTTTASDA